MDANEIKKQIDRLWGNTRRPLADARADLRDIKEHVEMLLDSSNDGDEA